MSRGLLKNFKIPFILNSTSKENFPPIQFIFSRLHSRDDKVEATKLSFNKEISTEKLFPENSIKRNEFTPQLVIIISIVNDP